jgi:hypothetical protein
MGADLPRGPRLNDSLISSEAERSMATPQRLPLYRHMRDPANPATPEPAWLCFSRVLGSLPVLDGRCVAGALSVSAPPSPVAASAAGCNRIDGISIGLAADARVAVRRDRDSDDARASRLG